MGNPLFDAMQWHNEQRLEKEDPTLYYARQRKKNEIPAEIKQGRSKENRQLARAARAIVTNKDVEQAKKQQEILSTLGYTSFNGEITPENYQYARGALYGTYKGGKYLIKYIPKASRYVVNAIKNNPKTTLFTTIPVVGGTVGGIVGANMYDEEPQTEVNINQEQPTSEISQAELDSLFINNKR